MLALLTDLMWWSVAGAVVIGGVALGWWLRPRAPAPQDGPADLAAQDPPLLPASDPAVAGAAAFAGAFAAEYLSWDEDNPQHRAAALDFFLQHAISTPQPGWNGHGRRTADLTLPGAVDTHHHPLLIVDVRVRCIPYERTNDPSLEQPDTTPLGPDGHRRPASPAITSGWRALPAQWTRLVVPVRHDDDRLHIHVQDVQDPLHQTAS